MWRGKKREREQGRARESETGRDGEAERPTMSLSVLGLHRCGLLADYSQVDMRDFWYKLVNFEGADHVLVLGEDLFRLRLRLDKLRLFFRGFPRACRSNTNVNTESQLTTNCNSESQLIADVESESQLFQAGSGTVNTSSASLG